MTVSYVIPVYNKAPFLDPVLQAADAEWRQTGGEIVIVDDGSTDGSAAIIDAFRSGRPYVRFAGKPNGGVASATNLGFAMTRCPLVRFIDADDIILPGSTARLQRAIADHGAGFAYGIRFEYGDGIDDLAVPDASRARSWPVERPLRRVLTNQPFIPSVTLAVREAIAMCFPLPEQHRTGQDFIMGVRFARHTAFAEIDAICCWSPLEAPGRLSASKARAFADLALLLADEWDLGWDGAWAADDRRYAVRRMAGRASRYAARHLHWGPGRLAWLTWRKWLTYLPSDNPASATLRAVAATYAEALAAPGRYP
jgi:hypothetical protein